MARERESFLLRVDPVVMDGLRRWASDDLRSVNAQVEFLLRRALSEAGRLPGASRGGSARKGPGQEEGRGPEQGLGPA